MTTSHPDYNVTAAALEWLDCGASPLRIREDGTKAPLGDWEEYQQRRATREEVLSWGAMSGLGIVCGAVSGNLEMLELEARAVAEGYQERFMAAIRDAGLFDLWRRVAVGYTEMTPSGGLHFLYRCDQPVSGNLKLARRPETDEELEARKPDANDLKRGFKKKRPVVLVETRGEGGQTVVAPSNGRTHPTGRPWAMMSGGPRTLATITTAERESLLAVARSVDDMPAATVHAREAQVVASSGISGRTWESILVPAGWGWLYEKDFTDYWCRPGKADGVSATSREDGGLFVFSSSTDFETEVAYSKAAAIAVLEGGMDGRDALATYGTAQEAYRAAEEAMLAQFSQLDPPGAQTPAEGNPPDDNDAAAPPPVTGGAVRMRGDNREPLNVTSSAYLYDTLCRELGTGSLAGVFSRSDKLVVVPRYGEEGYRASGEHRSAADPPAQVVAVDDGMLRSFIAGRRWCFKESVIKTTGEVTRTYVLPPVDPFTVIVKSMPEVWSSVPVLDGVTHTPLLRPDGTILGVPGYDPATRLLYLPECAVPVVADNPSGEDVALARKWIDYLVKDFPFVTPGDRANFLGMLITPLLRAILPPPWPQLGLNAPQRGSGKTLLATVLRILHGGEEHPAPGSGKQSDVDEELRKVISTILTDSTGQVVVFDNMTGIFRSGMMAKLLTGHTWADRGLGRMKSVRAVNDRLWVLTGNNLQVGGDLARRTVWCSIDAKTEFPENRTDITEGNLPAWTEANRGTLLWAALVLCKVAYPGLAALPAPRKDSYGQWEAGVRHVLKTAGIPGGFREAAAEPTRIGADDEEWSKFLATVHAWSGGKPFTAKQLSLACVGKNERYIEGLSVIGEALPGDLSEKLSRNIGSPAVIARSLGKWLGNRRGAWADGYTVVDQGDDGHRNILWVVNHKG